MVLLRADGLPPPLEQDFGPFLEGMSRDISVPCWLYHRERFVTCSCGSYSQLSDVCKNDCYCIWAKNGPEPQDFGVMQ